MKTPKILVVCACLLLSAGVVLGASATWNSVPANGDWNDPVNWSAGGPPNAFADTATFGSSSITGVSLSDYTTVDGIAFTAGASAYTISTGIFGLTIGGVGITNNSGVTQNFATASDGLGFNRGSILFLGSAMASPPTGSPVMFSNNVGIIRFSNSSNAGNGVFVTNGSPDGTKSPGNTEFGNSSNAGSGTFTSNGALASGGLGGFTSFLNISNGGTAVFVSNGATVNGAGGGVTTFQQGSTANAALLIAGAGSGGGGGGTILFSSAATGGTARVQVFGNGNLDIGLINTSPFSVTIGSLEGNGNVFLSNRNLTVGIINSNTLFSGVIQNGGQGGFNGGSLTKVGTGQLTLAGANTYTGGTVINGGILTAGGGSLVSVGGAIAINSGGTLRLSAAGQHIGVNIPMTLNGGTFNMNGFSEGSPGARGLGALTLTATSTIDFGAGASSVVEFGGVGPHSSGAVLQITNWNGVPVTGGSGDRLLFEGLSTTFAGAYAQSDVSFNGTTGYVLIQFGGPNPYFEVTSSGPVSTPTPPPTPTPTPSPTATATATIPPTPTPTPTDFPSRSISGTVVYCPNPVPGPVPNVTLTLTGTASSSTLTDGSGNYSLTGLPNGGNYTVTPTKAARVPGSAGITGVDAIAVQRHFLNLGTPLSGCRLTAADVTGTSGVDGVDAIAIQRFFLGFTSGIANTGTYKFTPLSRTYTGLIVNQTSQNYDALVFGDVASSFVERVDGSPATEADDGMSAVDVRAPVAVVALPNAALDASVTDFIVPVTTTTIDAGDRLVGFQGDFTFDERVVSFQSEPVQRVGLTSGNWNVAGNVLPGTGPIRTLRISAYSNDFTALSGSGTLFELRMTRVSKAAQSTQLLWASPPDQFIFIDADLNTQTPGYAASGSVTPSGRRK